MGRCPRRSTFSDIEAFKQSGCNLDLDGGIQTATKSARALYIMSLTFFSGFKMFPARFNNLSTSPNMVFEGLVTSEPHPNLYCIVLYLFCIGGSARSAWEEVNV